MVSGPQRGACEHRSTSRRRITSPRRIVPPGRIPALRRCVSGRPDRRETQRACGKSRREYVRDSPNTRRPSLVPGHDALIGGCVPSWCEIGLAGAPPRAAAALRVEDLARALRCLLATSQNGSIAAPRPRLLAPRPSRRPPCPRGSGSRRRRGGRRRSASSEHRTNSVDVVERHGSEVLAVPAPDDLDADQPDFAGHHDPAIPQSVG